MPSIQGHGYKLWKLAYYLRQLASWPVPHVWYRRQREALLHAARTGPEADYLRERVDYYNRIEEPFEAVGSRIGDFADRSSTTYYFDARAIFRYFPPELRVNYQFGDVSQVPEVPTLLKSRPIRGSVQNSILLKLNRVRHFYFVRDRLPYEHKIDRIVWRGKVNKERRRNVLRRFHDHPLCDFAPSNPPEPYEPWAQGFMSRAEQLRYKMVLCVEGNEVASNLKWVMSSSSLCLMAMPRYETWFMEGRLRPDHHFVRLEDDHSDLPEKVEHYLAHPEQARRIIHNAQEYVEQFRDETRELLLSLLVLDKYARWQRPVDDGLRG